MAKLPTHPHQPCYASDLWLRSSSLLLAPKIRTSTKSQSDYPVVEPQLGCLLWRKHAKGSLTDADRDNSWSPVVACAQVPKPFIRMEGALPQEPWAQWAIFVSFFWHRTRYNHQGKKIRTSEFEARATDHGVLLIVTHLALLYSVLQALLCSEHGHPSGVYVARRIHIRTGRYPTRSFSPARVSHRPGFPRHTSLSLRLQANTGIRQQRRGMGVHRKPDEWSRRIHRGEMVQADTQRSRHRRGRREPWPNMGCV